MQGQNMRVLIASEYSGVRYFLKDVVEEKAGTVIVGEADNVTTALTLARNLRPDVAIIDCYLPYIVGLDSIPLSRIGGLDTAQTISQEIPNMRVVLVTNLDAGNLPEDNREPDIIAYLCRQSKGACIPFTLQELHQEIASPGTLIFANVEVKEQYALRQRVSNISDKAILFGGLGILGGLSLMLTIILAGAGVFLTLAGATAVFLGLVGKLITLRLPKAR